MNKYNGNSKYYTKYYIILKALYYYVFLFCSYNSRNCIKSEIYFCYSEREKDKEREKESYRNIKHVNTLFMSFEK